ncbi:phytase [Echinicola vietnamensis]|uniref:3-phytase (Myo-inositol-hexaphosphate 3-phosphohydrolase) n=1 Tax=Echinicola vietnamensis (strain DSM 17526 / LMG 23754 / KMM 6221) TaxID=926556 RepID=L0G3A3_ECHVK|nr:phytase [Echinicola vietnamensis]AGA80709.1 3-phytase (myo-inositol-hexaphosphate 3-phosphohydrolase) [Echinicola vietnamensis DSM 17526]
MTKNRLVYGLCSLGILAGSCSGPSQQKETQTGQRVVKPLYVTDQVIHDTDDPAIWVNPSDAAKSLIVGTDKDADGALYVFDLKGKAIDSLTVRNIQRPNNVDISYGLSLGDSLVDFAVTGERLTSKLRFYALPIMQEIAPGGIEIYQGETGNEYRDLMGVAVYHSPKNDKQYVIAGRKNGPQDGTYLWQYEIKTDGGQISLELVRKFGQFSGQKEIEAIAVDNELGYIYYSDEGVGVRKYYADPEMGNEQLALFATEGFTKDHEGISIYKLDDKTGYILVSDQEANQFHVFPREGAADNPHDHQLITKIKTSTVSSDGSESLSTALGADFPHGIFVAMSDDKTFQIYTWEDMAGDTLKLKK